MEDLVKFLIEKLTDNPDGIVINRDGDEIKVVSPKSEMGKLIGKQGRIAKAIRTIVRAAGKDGERVNVEIVEAE